MNATPTSHSPAISRVLLSCSLMSLLAAAAGAQRLPIRTYTIADGLPQNVIGRIVRDANGFLWFCTPEGLSRLDGYTFDNYGIDDGLTGSRRSRPA